MGRWSLTEKKFQITILGLSHKVCCLLPSTSYCKMVRFTADSFPVDSQSTLIFNEVSAVKGRAWHTCDPNTDDWERVRLYGQVTPTLPLRLVFFRVVFTCGLFSFFPLFPWPWGIAVRPLNHQNTKSKRNKQTVGARKSSRQQSCRPKFIVKSLKCWIMLKD